LLPAHFHRDQQRHNNRPGFQHQEAHTALGPSSPQRAICTISLALSRGEDSARDAGIKTKLGCDTFRATGITAYLENGGTLEHAQQIAAHESPRTTKLYDRTTDQITLDEIERIAI